MPENKMKQVAKMLGVELGEIFYIKNRYYKYRLTEKTIEYYDELDQQWTICPYRILGLLNGEDEIIKKSILDEKEKEYLSAVIRPFRDKIEYICKSRYGDVGAEYLDIEIYDDFMCLPSFEKNTMYKGMELEKKYTLEELGL